MLTVACVKWGDKYGPEYVQRLAAGVARNLKVPYEFVCFTDHPVPEIACRPLPSTFPGWWAKIGLFRPGLLNEETLYLDLDVIVTGALDVFLRRETDLPRKVWALDDFSYSLRNPRIDLDPRTQALLGGRGTCNSSVMYWQEDCGSDVWDLFDGEVMEKLHGDQNWITRILYPHTLALYPTGHAWSYKYNVLSDIHFAPRQTASVVVFHGDPKPHQLDAADPLKKLWLAK